MKTPAEEASIAGCPERIGGGDPAPVVRVRLPAERLAQWFESRAVLQNWVLSKPDLGVEELSAMFYNQPTPTPSS